MRLDKLLWFLRLTKTRPLAQALVEEGHIRLNGRRVDRAAHKVATGDVLVIPLAAGVRIIEILSLPLRRGPATEAQACYRALDAGQTLPIAAQESQAQSPAAPGRFTRDPLP